jgi:hypothetical protein
LLLMKAGGCAAKSSRDRVVLGDFVQKVWLLLTLDEFSPGLRTVD